ncbi:hypothetical protein [Bordetella sp. N]|uniref:hypothetical protein n=1 Tax=Bordetella sp. N TaxID=1746199 RepID=UPI00070AC053|nr:hypothetical protein [Bordetella sp. N]ALM83103.1 hypothetical protein ASB57_09190 [Bordetella sp. N]
MSTEKSKRFFSRCLDGEADLWRIFWLVYVSGEIIFRVWIRLGVEIVRETGHTHFVLGVLLLHLVFGLWVVMSVWRCAKNVQWRFAYYLGRFFSALGALGLAVGAHELLQIIKLLS